MIKIAISLILLSATLIYAAEKLPNIDHLSYGVNIFTADPIDPNGRMISIDRVFQPTYEDQKTTDDDRFLIPDQINALRNIQCIAASTTSEVRGETSFKDHYKKFVSGSASFFSMFSFTASRSYETRTEHTEKHSEVYTDAYAMCKIYRASWGFH